MTTQEAYEQIRSYFSRPDAALAATTTGDTCFYRQPMPDGSVRKCAVGCLIPDELYDLELDEQNVAGDHAMVWTNELREFFQDVDVDFINEAQAAHDGTASSHGHFAVSAFIARLDKVADRHHLKVVSE
jgi:hypothetical protein